MVPLMKKPREAIEAGSLVAPHGIEKYIERAGGSKNCTGAFSPFGNQTEFSWTGDIAEESCRQALGEQIYVLISRRSGENADGSGHSGTKCTGVLCVGRALTRNRFWYFRKRTDILNEMKRNYVHRSVYEENKSE